MLNALSGIGGGGQVDASASNNGAVALVSFDIVYFPRRSRTHEISTEAFLRVVQYFRRDVLLLWIYHQQDWCKTRTFNRSEWLRPLYGCIPLVQHQHERKLCCGSWSIACVQLWRTTPFRILIFDFDSRSVRWTAVDSARSARSQLCDGGSQGSLSGIILDSIQHGRSSWISDSTRTRLRLRLQYRQQQHLHCLSHPLVLRLAPPVGSRQSRLHVPSRRRQSYRPRQPKLALRNRWTLHLPPEGSLH